MKALCLSAVLFIHSQTWAGSAQATIATSFTQIPNCDFATAGGLWTTSTPFAVSGSVLQQSVDGTVGAGPMANKVQCTIGTPWQVGVSPGITAGSSDAKRLLLGQTTGATLEVRFFRDAAHTIPWGNTPGVNVWSGVGTGTTTAQSIYYSIPSQPTAPPDTYNGTFDFIVTY
ncbi:MAG: spore coat U domain-containing protein [Pseudomonadales bacterium]